jgi:hypothetical protein
MSKMITTAHPLMEKFEAPKGFRFKASHSIIDSEKIGILVLWEEIDDDLPRYPPSRKLPPPF